MKRNYILIILLLLIRTSYCQDNFSIHGNVEGFQDSAIIYLYYSDTEIYMDSSMIINNVFKFYGRIKSESQCRLLFRNPKNNRWIRKIFWLEPSNITVEGSMNDFRNLTVTGSEMQFQEDKLDSISFTYEQSKSEIFRKIRNTNQSDSSAIKAMWSEYYWVDSALLEEQLIFVENHPDWKYGTFLLYSLIKRHKLSKERCEKYFSNTAKHLVESKYGKLLAKYLELSTDFEIGDKYVDFTLTSVDGNTINFSELNGQNVLLYFWESGCRFSRLANKNIAKLRNEYEEDDLCIVSVNLNLHKHDVEKAIEEDKIDWFVLTDYKGFEGIVPMIYRIGGVPQFIVINQDGVIVSKDFRFDELEEKIEMLFN